MNELNFDIDFSINLPDETNLISELDRISYTISNKSISAIPFGCELDIDKLFKKHHSLTRIISKEKENKSVTLYKITHKSNDEYKIEKEGYFIIYSHPNFNNIYIAFTTENSEFLHHELKPLLSSYYNSIIFSFIKSKNLKELIEQFQVKNVISEIKIKRASCLLRYNEKPMSTVTWSKLSLDDAFRWANDYNGWFKSLQFDAIRNRNTIANIYINRNGVIRTDRQFQLVYDSFIYSTCNLIDLNLKQFKNRDRRSNDNLDAKPLIIEYDSEIFENVDVNKKFINAISKLGNTSISTLHGNPYVHLSIIDYLDGSNFDLWVLSKKEIILVPQMKGTVSSIKRIINHIFDSFAEGEIKDYQSSY